MAFSLISSVLKQSTNANTTTSSAINTTGANLIVVSIADYGVATAAVLSDSQGNTWTGLTARSTSGARVKIYYCYNPTTSASHTFTATGTGIYVALSALAFSGSDATPFDVENGTTGASGTSKATGSVSPSLDNELIITSGGWSNAGQPTSLSINSGFTISQQAVNVSGTAFGLGTAYLIQTTKGAVNPTWSWGSTSEHAFEIATFKASTVTPNTSNFFQLFN